MTKSTGARELRRRREELFSAEHTLRRMLLHLCDAIGWARQMEDRSEYYGRIAAYATVRTAHVDVVAEQKDIT